VARRGLDGRQALSWASVHGRDRRARDLVRRGRGHARIGSTPLTLSKKRSSLPAQRAPARAARATSRGLRGGAPGRRRIRHDRSSARGSAGGVAGRARESTPRGRVVPGCHDLHRTAGDGPPRESSKSVNLQVTDEEVTSLSEPVFWRGTTAGSGVTRGQLHESHLRRVRLFRNSRFATSGRSYGPGFLPRNRSGRVVGDHSAATRQYGWSAPAPPPGLER